MMADKAAAESQQIKERYERYASHILICSLLATL
jgi:hypothetical protein